MPDVDQQDSSCSDFDAWEWAQSVFESDPEQYDALDPDGDGEACLDLPRNGFAPAFWTEELPDDVEEAKILRVIDGDTFEVEIDGVSNRVRIYRADTPETQNEQHCGGQQATDFATWALSFNDNEDGTVYLERDENERDQYGRELAYMWFEVDGNPYMLNHILINNGWAEDVDYGDRMYDDELQDAAAFAERNELGVWPLCGGFEVPLAQAPAAAQPAASNPTVPQAQAPTGVQQPTQAPGGQQPAVEAPTVQEPVVQAPEPTTPTELQPESDPPPVNMVEADQAAGDDAQVSNDPPESELPGCDPNYTPCIPVSPGGLTCGDIGYITVQVIGVDIYGLDGNPPNGLGCDSY